MGWMMTLYLIGVSLAVGYFVTTLLWWFGGWWWGIEREEYYPSNVFIHFTSLSEKKTNSGDLVVVSLTGVWC